MEWRLSRSDAFGQRCALGCPFFLFLFLKVRARSVTSLQTPWTSSLLPPQEDGIVVKIPLWACLMLDVWACMMPVWSELPCGLHFQFHQLVRCLLLWVSFLFVQGDTVHVLLFWQVPAISVLSGAKLNPLCMVQWCTKFAFAWDPKLKTT